MAISHLNAIKFVFLVFRSLYMVLHFFQNHVCWAFGDTETHCGRWESVSFIVSDSWCVLPIVSPTFLIVPHCLKKCSGFYVSEGKYRDKDRWVDWKVNKSILFLILCFYHVVWIITVFLVMTYDVAFPNNISKQTISNVDSSLQWCKKLLSFNYITEITQSSLL